tara:strand:- start:245 stop:406 length:162 start_codon:yes stop_codon:yes gene_type:complete
MLRLLEKHVSMKVLLAVFLLGVGAELHFEFIVFLLALRMHGLGSIAAWELINI